MPGLRGHRKRYRFDKIAFENVETDVLEAFLRADIDTPEAEQIDADDIMYIAGLLAGRRDAPKDVAAAKAEFYQKYYPLVDDAGGLFDFGDDDGAENACRVSGWRLWLRRTACVTAIVLMVVFGGAVTAGALGGHEPWGMVGKWTDGTFGFVLDTPTQELQRTVDECGFGPDVVPKWLPKGYEFESVDKSVSDVMTKVFAVYSKDEQVDVDGQTNIDAPADADMQDGADGAYADGDHIDELYIELSQKNIDNMVTVYEKDDSDVVVYSFGDVDHYIMQNIQNSIVAWYNDDIECCISGKFTEAEAKRMIESIY